MCEFGRFLYLSWDTQVSQEEQIREKEKKNEKNKGKKERNESETNWTAAAWYDCWNTISNNNNNTNERDLAPLAC